MEDFDKLIKGWKKISSDAAIENENFYNTNKSTIMESIINYEKNEKQEKKKQIALMFISISCFVFAFAVWIGLGQIEITSKNLIGAILLLIAFSISLLTNKTDDFPDARLLDSRKYLLELKQNVTSRRKRHILFSIVSILLALPGIYFLLHNMPAQIFPDFINPDWIVFLSAIVGFVGGMLNWRKNYDATTKPLLIEIDQMMLQFN